ncbi:hypothetical protein [Streptomyces axinellae]|uniref:hypothetical protein n=1 Tax=Streptomyces axinellae TaxID=552788 RepID=UPI0031D3C4BA
MLSGTLALALLLGLTGLAACDSADRDSPGRAAFQAVLARQTAAVRTGDERGYLATLDPRAHTYRTEQRRVFHNLRRLPEADWSYQVAEVTPDGAGRATVEVRLRYRFKGYDRGATPSTERLRFVRRDGTWRVAAEASGSTVHLWEQGTLSVVKSAKSLVMGVGHGRATLRALARAADKAVPAVGRAWPGTWPRRLVLEMPASVAAMARLLDAPATSYEGIAAVTTGEASGGGTPGAGGARAAPADRVLVNPTAYAVLSEEGRQVVLTHEATHVATREQTTAATPMWLSEGLADWAGYRESDQTPLQAAPELARAVAGTRARDGGTAALRALPADADFRFGNDPARLARAYEGGWLACRMIAEQWGADRLVALYERVGRQRGERGRQGPGVDAALRTVLGVSTPEFTDRWRVYVTRELAR